MFQNPSSRQLLPHAEAHPAQALALLRTWEDLSLAQQWNQLEVHDLEECDCTVFRGTPKNKTTPASVFPMALNVHTSMEKLRAVFVALETRFPTLAPAVQTVYLAIVEKDSSVVYYVLKDGIVSPLEVPE
ncbi:hypothetical protein RQP46_003305 [Phenoliferia psychrophenolica]